MFATIDTQSHHVAAAAGRIRKVVTCRAAMLRITRGVRILGSNNMDFAYLFIWSSTCHPFDRFHQ
jgi:hypothetical protein